MSSHRKLVISIVAVVVVVVAVALTLTLRPTPNASAATCPTGAAANRNVVVFLTADATDEQVEAVRQTLTGQGACFDYLDSAAAYQKFQTIFSPGPGDTGLVEASEFPRSFEVTVADQAALDALKAALPATGIDNVVLERAFDLPS